MTPGVITSDLLLSLQMFFLETRLVIANYSFVMLLDLTCQDVWSFAFLLIRKLGNCSLFDFVKFCSYTCASFKNVLGNVLYMFLMVIFLNGEYLHPLSFCSGYEFDRGSEI